MGDSRNLDTAGIGRKGINRTEEIVLDAGHLLQTIDGDIDEGIDGYIILRKYVKFRRINDGLMKRFEDYVETGGLIGIQVKTVSSIPKTGAASYYINISKQDYFAVNFNSKEKLDKKKEIWKRFIGPMILVFVDLETRNCWWADLKDDSVYENNDYSVLVKKTDYFSVESFIKISKLGRELFVKAHLIDINTNNGTFLPINLLNIKESAKQYYKDLNNPDELYYPTNNPRLGEVKFTKSGWKHITRLNRRKMRIVNSLVILPVAKLICEQVNQFSTVKRGHIRSSKKYVKRVEYLTLRANVNFNFRQSSIVQVVLRRVKTFDLKNPERIIPDEIFFHSIYEPFRKE